MRWRVGSIIALVFGSRLRRMIATALRFGARGGLRDDQLRLHRISGQLHVEWAARAIHPWDRGLPSQRQDELFCDQTIRDTDVAIARLFDRLPEIEAIVVRVVEPHPAGRIILAGTVQRSDMMAIDLPPSPRMRLKLLGVRYNISGSRLEPLNETG